MPSKDLVFNIIARDGASAVFGRVATSMDTLATKTEAIGKNLTKLGTSMNRTGRELSEAVTLPLAAIGYESVKAAANFQEAMLRIHTHVDVPLADVKKLSDEVLKLADTAQQGPNELAEALYHLKSVGLDDVSAMRALKDASDLAALGGANLEDTTNALAGAWRTGIKGAQDFGQEAALLNSIIGQGNMQTQDLADAMGTGFLATAHSFGAGLRDVGAALAVLTDSGTPAADAATRLRMSMSLMGAPTAQAAKALAEIGLTSTDLADRMRSSKGLVGAIDLLHEKLVTSGKSATEQAQILSQAFGGGRSSGAILTLLGSVDALDQKYRQITPDVKKFNDAVALQRKTPEAQWHEFTAQLEKTGIAIGNDLIPKLEGIARVVQDVAEWFDRLDPGTRSLIEDFALVAAAAGPVLFIFGAVTRSVGQLITGTGRLLGLLAQAPAKLSAFAAESDVLAMSLPELAAAAGSFVVAVAPIAAVVGGAITVLSLMSSHQADAQVSVLSYTSAFEDNTDAVDENTAAQAKNISVISAKALAQQGLGAALKDAHANIKLLVDGIQQSSDTLDHFAITGDEASHSWASGIPVLGTVSKKLGDLVGLGDKANKVYTTNGAAASAFGRELLRLQGTMSSKDFTALIEVLQGQVGALNDAKLASSFTGQALHGLAGDTSDAGDAAAQAAQQIDDLKTALSNAFDVVLGVQQATDSLYGDFSTLASAVKDARAHGQSLIDVWTAQTDAARQVRSSMDSVVQGASNLLIAYQQSSGATADQVWQKSQQIRQSLLDQARAAGLNDQAIWGLIGSYDQMLAQADIHKTVVVDTSQAQANVQALINKFGGLANYAKLYADMVAGHHLSGTVVSGGKPVPGHAVGGFLSEGWNTAGELGAELLYKSGSSVQVFSASQSNAMLAAAGAKAQTVKVVTVPGESGPTTFILQVDGKTLAKAVAPAMRGELGHLEVAFK
ncbi:MAG TPA: phage tail tape measure protein [Nocardioidaceae bacterium]|nr:phage tail tape measure protein [Nocardioidaceae bacterium]